MKKYLMMGLVIVMILGLTTMGMAASVVHTDLSGNNGEFNIWTTMQHLDTDHFYGRSDGSLSGWQTTRVGASGQWTYDGYDIDRYGEFSGGGELTTYSEYNSKEQWYPSRSEHLAWVESSDTGWLGQNTHWGGSVGGVKDVDQWNKQRTMEMYAGGVYEMGFAAHDLRHGGTYGNPATGSWAFNFSAEGDGDARLFVDNTYATGEHGGGQWYTPDDYHSDWDFGWTGDLTQDTSNRGDRGYSFNEWQDMVNNNIWGDTVTW